VEEAEEREEGKGVKEEEEGKGAKEEEREAVHERVVVTQVHLHHCGWVFGV
jgi:hypothetical protein